jgi:hypothetical protein
MLHDIYMYAYEHYTAGQYIINTHLHIYIYIIVMPMAKTLDV